MFAYCHLCRTVFFDPPRIHHPPTILETRYWRPKAGEFFSNCPVCRREQVFIEIKPGGEPNVGSSGLSAKQ